jgi:hypothetical protein
MAIPLLAHHRVIGGHRILDALPKVPKETTSILMVAEANRSGSGPGTPSLADVRPVEPPKLRITPREQAQLDEWNRRAVVAGSRMSLFDDPNVRKPEFEVVPWRFQSEFRCSASNCNGQTHTIVDWEVKRRAEQDFRGAR